MAVIFRDGAHTITIQNWAVNGANSQTINADWTLAMLKDQPYDPYKVREIKDVFKKAPAAKDEVSSFVEEYRYVFEQDPNKTINVRCVRVFKPYDTERWTGDRVVGIPLTETEWRDK